MQETTLKFRMKTLLNEEVSVWLETINRHNVLISFAVSQQPTLREPPKGIAVAISRDAALAVYNSLGNILGCPPVQDAVNI